MSRLRLSFAGALLTLLLAAPAAFAQGEQAVPNGAPATPPTLFSKNRVIVQWTPSADRADKVAARADADVDYETNLGDPDFQLVEVEPGQTPGDAVAELEADPAVAVAERDSYSIPHGIPSDPLFNQLWGLQNLGLGVDNFVGAIAGDDANVVAAWDRAIGTPSTVIADLDSGYRFEHPDLGPVAWTNPGEVANGADDDGNGIVDDLHGADFVGSNSELSALPIDGDPTDDDLLSGGHGVHTAGTMGAAGNNGVGISGVARNVRIMPLRVCSRYPSLNGSRCPTSSQINAINYAGSKGARVANMSLGGNTPNPGVINAIAANPHVLFVISAGNDGGDNDGGGAAPKGHHYPCDYRPTVDAVPPSPVDNIVCVAATNQADGLASFSDWGAVSVDLGAPGTETLSTYSFNTPIDETFQANDFSSKWTATGANGGFQRSNEAPLTSFGMTDSPGAAPTASTVRESTSAAMSIPAGLAPCNLLQTRNVAPGTGGSYTYSVLLNGVTVDSFTSTATTAGRFSRELTTKLSPGGAVQVRFRYTAGSAPGSGDGVWLDDIELECAEPVGQSMSYEFLQGTSMAAPHVTGAAGLLFSMKPSATVSQVRSALLNSVDPIPSLAGKTVTGGRLNVADALSHLVPVGTETATPETVIVSGPEGTTASTSASFQFTRTDADVGAFECQVDSGSFSPCASPTSFTVAPGSHQFQVRAKVPSGIVDPTPATRSWTVSSPPSPPPPTLCKVPKLAGLKLAAAKSALTAAHCTLGKVALPKAKKGKKMPPLVVRSSTPAANASTAGAVDLKLGPKPKKKRKKHRR